MPCKELRFALSDGTDVSVISCSRGGAPRPPCACCGRPALYVCDAVVTRDGKPATCDRPMCARCRVKQRTKGLVFCGPHARAADAAALAAAPAAATAPPAPSAMPLPLRPPR